MSSSTCVNLLGHVEPEQIFDFIRKNFDSNAKFYTPHKYSFDGLASDYDFIKEIYDDTNKATSCDGFICSFKSNKNNRVLFYAYSNYNSYDNLEYSSQYNLENMVKAETTYLSLGNWGSSVEIMTAICRAFGGWIDEDDCDGKPYYWIPADGVIEPKKIRHVTMEEVYKQFGEVVVIDK